MLYKELGILSATVFLAGDTPYLINTIKASGKTRPHRVTWGMVVLLNTIGFANQWASGASNSLWLFGAAVLMCGAIFLASLRNGVGGHSEQDLIVFIFCMTGVCLWLIFNSPLLSIFMNIAVSYIALLPTIVKAKKSPETETKIAWLAGTVSALMALISVGKLDIKLFLLPGASVIMQAYMVYILYFLKRTPKLKPKTN